MKKEFIMLIIFTLFIGHMAFAEQSRQIPLLFNFQGALTDEGGNPLPDGTTGLTFHVLDSSGAVLYEESQDLEVVNGAVSAIVGNGLDPTSSSATGGVPAEVFDPTDVRYLQVTVAGQKPYDLLEIVTAPYALWADTALKVAPEAITGDMIGKGVITKDHLDEQLFTAIFPNGLPKSLMPSDTVYSGDFTSFKDTIQSSAGAGQVGVAKTFIYSGAGTVEGVLSDFDLALKKKQEEVDFAKKDYGTKVDNLQADIDKEAATRKEADDNLQTNINNESSARQNADTVEANTRAAGDLAEATTRAAADTGEANTRYIWDKWLQDIINGVKNDLTKDLSTHTSATSAHGISGDVVGTSDAQTLTNKVLIAPTIKGGANINPDISPDLSPAANEGVVVDGNLKVTGDIKIAGNLIDSPTNARLTPFAYGRISDSCALLGGYNVTLVTDLGCDVRFLNKPTDANYTVVFASEYGGGDEPVVIYITTDGFAINKWWQPGSEGFAVFWNAN